MTGLVVDASVAVKWLVDEKLSENAVRLLDTGLTLIAPELLFAEASNALWAIHRRGDINAADFTEASVLLKSAPISVPSAMRDLAAPAGRLAVDLDHPVYDCFYLALAVQEQFRVVTADRRFHERVRSHAYLASQVEFLGDMR